MRRQAIEDIIEALKQGEEPVLSQEDFPCFSEGATQGNPNISPESAARIARQMDARDLPVFERALQAIDRNEQAWIGFKFVYDAQAAVANVDNEVTKKYGEQGSADGLDAVFFCNDAKEIVCARVPSPRDVFQMKDCTRGPSMHTEQFDGVTWCSAALQEKVRVWLLGASDAAAEVAALADHVGFKVVAVDYDPAYLNPERFPSAQRVLLGRFDELDGIAADPSDYVCVLTRGHMFDPEGCLWAARNHVAFAGMMGCKGKNETVRGICLSRGMTEKQWDAIKRPIGLKFGAKSPAELAIAIVAELVDVRYRQRYDEAARQKHELSLGR